MTFKDDVHTNTIRELVAMNQLLLALAAMRRLHIEDLEAQLEKQNNSFGQAVLPTSSLGPVETLWQYNNNKVKRTPTEAVRSEKPSYRSKADVTLI